MYDKIIFLDIDGVLNTWSEQGKYKDYIDPVKLQRVADIINATGAKVVISSNWRFDMDCVLKNLDLIKDSIIDRTGSGESRLEEIHEWLENNPTNKWVALDDLFLDTPNLVMTNEATGITNSNASLAVSMLNDTKYDDLYNKASVFCNVSKIGA